MKRHDLDLTSLIAGMVFLIVAASHLLAAATGSGANLGWLVPAALVAVGVAGLGSALRRRSDDAAPEDESAVGASTEL